MTYTTTPLVQAEFKGIVFTLTSAVTSADVTEFIRQESAAIDTYLYSQYVVPISGTVSLTIMTKICTFLVAERIAKVLSFKGLGSQANDVTEKKLGETAQKLLDDIMSGKILLFDAVLNSSQLSTYSQIMNDNIERQFTRDDKAW